MRRKRSQHSLYTDDEIQVKTLDVSDEFRDPWKSNEWKLFFQI